MNYDSGVIGKDERRALPHYEAEVPRRSRRRLILGGVVGVLVLLAAWAAFHRKAPPADASTATAQVPSVTVAEPGRQVVDRLVSATGSLAAKRDMPVAVVGEGGAVTRVLVEPGQRVAAGQVLATINRSVQTETAASLSAQVGVARSDLQIAQAELDRATALVDRGFISKADLQRKAATRDSAAARVKVAQALLGEAQARNGRLDIRAPAAGLVLTRTVEPGQVVSGGSGTLFRIAMGGELEMRATLSESDLAAVHVGTQAEVTPVGTTQAFHGRVWQVAPVVDPVSRQGVVRIELPYDPALRPGGFASATIHNGADTAPLLPQSAVQGDAKGNYVYVVGSDNKVARIAVKVGDVSDAGVVIVGGLSGKEKVVISAGAFLSPGQKVQPQLTVLQR